MIISAITIENFKSIKEPVRIELKPITLLFGPNSVGKSSVIQALHYAREILCNQKNPDIDKVEHGGDFVRLGGFKNIVHGHDINRAIRLRFELGFQFGNIGDHVDDLTSDFDNESPVDWILADLPDDAIKVKEFFLNQVAQGIFPWLEIIIKDETATGVSISSTSIGFGETTFLTFEGQTFDINKKYTVDTNSKLFPLYGYDSIASLRLEAISALEPFSDGDIELEIYRRFHGMMFDAVVLLDNLLPLPTLEAVPDSLLQIYILTGMCSEVSASDFEEYITYTTQLIAIDKGLIATCQRFQGINNAVYSIISNYIQNDLNDFRYIGPLREVPQLSSAPPKSIELARWANGLAAWDAMKFSQHTVDIVNKWLDSEQFNTGYSIGRKQFKEIAVCQENSNAEALLATYEKQPISRIDLYVFDEAHGVKLQPSDIGIGISQLLPIITLVTGRYEEGIIAIEQPELHIHPAMQLILGDLFIEGLNRFGYKNYDCRKRFIIETHSEHLLLRLLRRIRELSCIDYNEISYKDKVELSFSNYDESSLGIHILEPSKNGVKVTHIRVDEDGEFMDRWPQGFFNERFEELL